jgi:hypothetical protein
MIVDRVVVITFLTLFLGLVYGPIDVALSAPPEVARMDLLLDGTKVADLGPPWRTTIDLGPEIAPRELVAVARGRDGERLGEARQWINVARPRAEASFVLERDADGRVVAARLVWRCLVSPRPRSVSVTFDGRPVEANELSRIHVPPHVPSVSHLLLADLVFSGGITATAVASFGGQQHDETERELTAFPVRVAGGLKLKAGGLDGWFEAAGKPLPVAAVEDGLAEVLFVLAGNVRADLERLWLKDVWPLPWPRARPLDLQKGTRYRFVQSEPRVVPDPSGTSRLFDSGRGHDTASGSFLQVAHDLLPEVERKATCVAEAVAVSALSATARERRRAVVLLLGEGAVDIGPLDAARVRRFLPRIGVPLHVWRTSVLAPPAAGDWPEAVDASTIEALGYAFEALRHDLASQRIVWLEGRHARASVTATEKARGVVPLR